MPEIKAGRFVRYAGRTDLGPVVCPPYDVIDEAGRATLEAADPHNFVRLVLPRTLAGDGPLDRYKRARTELDRWRAEGVLVQDEAPSILAVEQSFVDPVSGEKRVRRGVQALLRLSEFSEGRVLPHERTLSGPKEDRLELLKAVGAHLSPVFVLFPDPANEVVALLEAVWAQPPDMQAEGAGALHKAWRVTDPALIDRVTASLAPRTGYIADGHHRYETALRYRALAREQGQDPTGTPVDTIPAFLCGMSDPGLRILPTHRLLHGLFPGPVASLAARAAEFFTVEPLPFGAFMGDGATQLQAALAKQAGRTFAVVGQDGRPALWTLRPDAPLARARSLPALPALQDLDVAVLHAVVFEHLLGLSRVSQERQENLKYEKDAGRALARVKSGEAQLAFVLQPTRMDQVRAVAEAGEVMPQKSTFFFPKIIDGFGLQLLDG